MAPGAELHPAPAQACALALTALVRVRGAALALPPALPPDADAAPLAPLGAIPAPPPPAGVAALSQAAVFVRGALQAAAGAPPGGAQHSAAVAAARLAAARPALRGAVLGELLRAEATHEQFAPHPHAAAVRALALRCLAACAADPTAGPAVLRALAVRVAPPAAGGGGGGGGGGVPGTVDADAANEEDAQQRAAVRLVFVRTPPAHAPLPPGPAPRAS